MARLRRQITPDEALEAATAQRKELWVSRRLRLSEPGYETQDELGRKWEAHLVRNPTEIDLRNERGGQR